MLKVFLGKWFYLNFPSEIKPTNNQKEVEKLLKEYPLFKATDVI